MKLKILIVEDSETLQDGWKESLLRVTPPIEVIQAFSIKEAERAFIDNPDLSAIVVDACVPGSCPNTMELVKKIRKSFLGHMIAVSSSDSSNDILVKAGCNHKTIKQKLIFKIKDIFDL
ncbi:MAG: hypothetical protein AAB781_00615 [Patescibacteria group bacterium]